VSCICRFIPVVVVGWVVTPGLTAARHTSLHSCECGAASCRPSRVMVVSACTGQQATSGTTQSMSGKQVFPTACCRLTRERDTRRWLLLS